MIIGEHESFIGTKVTSVISQVGFSYFPDQSETLFVQFISVNLDGYFQAQAP